MLSKQVTAEPKKQLKEQKNVRLKSSLPAAVLTLRQRLLAVTENATALKRAHRAALTAGNALFQRLSQQHLIAVTEHATAMKHAHRAALTAGNALPQPLHRRQTALRAEHQQLLRPQG